MRESGILWEQKTTANKSYTLTEKTWENIRLNAMLDGKTPALHITLGAKKRRLIVIEEDEWPSE